MLAPLSAAQLDANCSAGHHGTPDDEGIPWCDGIDYGCFYCDKPLCYRQVGSWHRIAANSSRPLCSSCTKG